MVAVRNRKEFALFRKHRDDLIAAQENERDALNKVITVLADEIEYLRYLLSQQPHMSPALRALSEPEALKADPDFRPYLSEDEEEILALRLNEHLSEDEANDALDQLRSELAPVIPLPSLEADT